MVVNNYHVYWPMVGENIFVTSLMFLITFVYVEYVCMCGSTHVPQYT